MAHSARALPRIAAAFPSISHVITRGDSGRIGSRFWSTSAKQIIAALAILSIPSASMAQVCPRAAPANSQIVKHLPPRTVKHPKGQTGNSEAGGLMLRVPLTPSNEYYLDFAVWYGPFDWESGHSGKIPGLAGGYNNSGCKPVHPSGWSARQHFFSGGTTKAYPYHQDRNHTCGDLFPWRNKSGTQFQLSKYKVYRVTQRVRVNTPNQYNGIDQVWINGSPVLNITGVRWRGNVAPTTARVDQLLYHSYSGGKSVDQAPKYDSYTHFCNMYVMRCMPDFAGVPGTCK